MGLSVSVIGEITPVIIVNNVRLRTETMRGPTSLRLYFSSLAYVLVPALRRLALAAAEWATAQVKRSG